MKQLSAIVLARNQEEMIVDCLESLSFCDEIVVVDNASTDRTAEIAKNMKARVVSFASDDFSKLRNKGLEEAKGEWVLYVDTDERVSDTLRESIKNQVSNRREKSIVAYKVQRKNFYYGRHEWPAIEKLERLFRKDSLKEWRGKLHESPQVKGDIGELDGFLLHYSHQQLADMVEKTIKWSEVEANLRFSANHPQMSWWRFFRVMTTAFFDSYIRQKGWKAGTMGLIESIYQSYSMFITYARLWELQQQTRKKDQ